MESCYGEQLLSELRAEVAAARDKCRGRQAPSLPLLRRRLQNMLARSGPAPGLAQYAQNVHYVAVPVQFKPVGDRTGQNKLQYCYNLLQLPQQMFFFQNDQRFNLTQFYARHVEASILYLF